MTSKSRFTLEDVARAAGVSKMTASRALRGASDVSEDTIGKVRQAAQRIGYVGNHLASALSGQRANLIGVVVPSMSNIVFAEVLSGIATGIEGSGLQPVFGVTDYAPDKEYEIVRNMLSWAPAGLIVTGLDQTDATRRLIDGLSIPVVQIMDVDGSPVDACVGLSHRAAGRAMAEALLATGHSRFAYLGCGLDADTRAKKRFDGFRSALAEASVTLLAEDLQNGPSTIRAGRAMTARMLENMPDLDCIYYSNDDLAAGGAYHCLAAGKSLQPPTLAGFNGLDLVENLPFPLVTSRTPRKQIGQTAAELIVGSRPKPKDRVIEFTPAIVTQKGAAFRRFPE